jgi:ParB family chromosome partitioning protein
MMLDLSALEDKSPSTAEPSGKPLDIPLTDIEEDPNQPRTEFSAEAMEEMTASIKARGVRQPVSVRPHPSKAGKWMLNFGARRYRGSKAAGKTSIPAFVDDTSEDFDQVIENEQRDNLKPMELALFIQRKLDAGVKKAEIARKLGKDGSVITQHLALVSPPAFIEAIYRDGRCTSPKTLYELRALHDRHSQAVESWCASVDEVTRKGVITLATQLKEQEQTRTKPDSTVGDSATQKGSTAAPSAPMKVDTRSIEAANQDAVGSQATDAPVDDKTVRQSSTVDNDKAQDERSSQAGKGDSQELPKETKFEEMKHPLMLVQHKGRPAAVLMNRKPSSHGLIHIQYEDGEEAEEVSASECILNGLIER